MAKKKKPISPYAQELVEVMRGLRLQLAEAQRPVYLDEEWHVLASDRFGVDLRKARKEARLSFRSRKQLQTVKL